ncbi:acyl-CoA dehydrogenase family protein [Streptomyces sp. HUAS ZL42]|uniref:acyl-CoA dehydrogenase family protein n=1 Tax=Streptomyces sp. HUAS ZL42 TaxID=3231715 RepID=UPI00345E6EDF
MSDIEVPTRQEMVRRVAELAPLLRGHAAWNEEHRRVHDESIEALADAGVFKLRVPTRYGGFEADSATLVDVATELGRADGSTAWVASVYWIPGWMACLFPDEVQDEVFARPDARVCGTLSPSATATTAKGGVVVNGKWGFQSGSQHAHWQEIIAILVPPEGQPYPIVALVPMTDLLIVDDWHTTGLKGTGSVSTVAQDVFIPAERVLPLPAILDAQSASKLNADSVIYRAPLLPVASASAVGPLVGMARGAMDAFVKRLPDRKITYTAYEKQSEAPITHLQIAEAAMKIDEAAFHAHRLSATLDAKCAEGSAWDVGERALARADLGATGRLAKEAADILGTASGGSSIYTSVPIQRYVRDLNAVTLHALMHPNTNAELYGRVLCGLDPNTAYI